MSTPPPPPRSTLFPYTTLFRSTLGQLPQPEARHREQPIAQVDSLRHAPQLPQRGPVTPLFVAVLDVVVDQRKVVDQLHAHADRKSTRLNSSHVEISYAVFCLKK